MRSRTVIRCFAEPSVTTRQGSAGLSCGSSLVERTCRMTHLYLRRSLPDPNHLSFWERSPAAERQSRSGRLEFRHFHSNSVGVAYLWIEPRGCWELRGSCLASGDCYGVHAFRFV